MVIFNPIYSDKKRLNLKLALNLHFLLKLKFQNIFNTKFTIAKVDSLK
jgi:hypothetical protein